MALLERVFYAGDLILFTEQMVKNYRVLYSYRLCGKDLIIQKGQMCSLLPRMQGHEFLM